MDEEFEWSSAVSVSEKFEWSSDDHDVAHFKDRYGDYCNGYLDILGFHPDKEIIFLSNSTTRGLAYHFNSSEIEVLGDLYPARYNEELLNDQLIWSGFTYTPCRMEEF
ncbi:hypothetical protein PR202_ga17122 [Eleusine coracana subsp. coracana]|uniref:Uncharacterized protein n=1 Tax=Eleusine coracana subsp. coracana TaxID=191504 RepID=A0AAV5CPN8_ELECO|nr:hypothetical protein PR202_ga17122 [Eleusine coracana subsp. coracana]